MSRNGAGPQPILDDLLATLQASDLSVLELRVLLQLAAHNACPEHLADTLDTEAKAIARATRSLAMRGLIGRRFQECGRDSYFEFRIHSGGREQLVPYLESGIGKAPPGKQASGAATEILARGDRRMIAHQGRRQLNDPVSES